MITGKWKEIAAVGAAAAAAATSVAAFVLVIDVVATGAAVVDLL